MQHFHIHRLIAATLLAATAGANAGVVDANGDYVAGYTGSTLGDLDVLSASAVFHADTRSFTIGGTMAANIGTSAGGFMSMA